MAASSFFFDDELVGERRKPAMDACALCDKPLVRENDIFMYKGDTPYCSDECRHKQMRHDTVCERQDVRRAAQRHSAGTEAWRAKPQESMKVSVAS